jgi:hypothetical protein
MVASWPVAISSQRAGFACVTFITHPGELLMVYLQITLKIAVANRAAAAGVYQQYKGPFLDSIRGAQSKELLVRDEDVQVLHGFDHVDNATAYLQSTLFTDDVVAGLTPLLDAAPDVRVYQVA